MAGAAGALPASPIRFASNNLFLPCYPCVLDPLLRQSCTVTRSYLWQPSPVVASWLWCWGAAVALGFLQPPAVVAQQNKQGGAGCWQQSYTRSRSSAGRDCGARHTIGACMLVVTEAALDCTHSFFLLRGRGRGLAGWPASRGQQRWPGASCLEGDGGVLQAGGGQQVESGGVAQGAPCSHIHKGEACRRAGGGWVGGWVGRLEGA